MRGRAFIDLAADILKGNTEAHRRGAAGRAYYGLMLKCRDALFRWGFTLPPRDNVHSFVRLRFVCAVDADLRDIGRALDWMVQTRARADYNLSLHMDFVSNRRAQQAIDEARDALALLDAIEADPARQAAAIAAIRAAFP